MKKKEEAIVKKTEEKTEEETTIVDEVEEVPIISTEKDTFTEIKSEEEEARDITKGSFDLVSWQPKTSLGKKVKSGEINSLDYILDNGIRILEESIVEALVPDLEIELLMVGQSKGKFGGGSRRVFKQTQKKTSEGNKPTFSTLAVIGNRDGFVGVGSGKSRETVPAREKAMRKAKLNIFKIVRGCGSWQCSCKEPHSIPVEVNGKVGSVEIRLIPAPKGTGLVVESEIAKVLKLAGIKDVWSKTIGHTEVRSNLIKATVNALKELSKIKISDRFTEKLGVVDGSIKKNEK